MVQVFKILFFVGFALFLGTIFNHVLVNNTFGAGSNFHQIRFVRQSMLQSVSFFIVPGMILMLLTGTIIIARQRLTPIQQPWLLLSVGFSAIICLNTLLILFPLNVKLARLAGQLGTGPSVLTQFHSVTLQETFFGALNLAFIFTVLGLSVFRPNLWSRSSSRANLEAVG